ncbi:MAG TPA: hypothetical protein VK897_04305 [Anaerolineales bacterium]|nr:hypothetical protein [Anaerolineales bacterium]
MSQKTSSVLFILVTLLCTATVAVSLYIPVQAQSMPTGGNKDNCVNCHEDLYFLHDTGNWFCLQESPMSCVDCHGGNPKALTKELAHTDRAAHPVINEDLSKCQECHPEACQERVEFFDQTAGISRVLVAAPYTAVYSIEEDANKNVEAPTQEPSYWIMFWEFLPFVIVTGLALVIYFVARRRHN